MKKIFTALLVLGIVAFAAPETVNAAYYAEIDGEIVELPDYEDFEDPNAATNEDEEAMIAEIQRQQNS